MTRKGSRVDRRRPSEMLPALCVCVCAWCVKCVPVVDEQIHGR